MRIMRKISSGLYRLDEQTILFRKLGRCLGLVRTNRNRPNATVKCATWAILKTATLEDTDILESLDIYSWRKGPGQELGEYDTKKEAVEAFRKGRP